MLPKLNSVPMYDLVIPSSGKKIRFRPFLVKEQKILLMAFETKDRRAIVRSMIDTLTACLEGDYGELTSYDVDYIFTQIRGKSVGEKVDLVLPCKECKTDNECQVDLDQLKIESGDPETIIEITPEISVKLKYPSYDRLLELNIMDENKSLSQVILDTVKASMHSVMTEEENILLADESAEELDVFIDSMTSEQFAKISQFVETIPAVKYDLTFTCINCKAVNEYALQGIDDFF